jgi:hypothetical protein
MKQEELRTLFIAQRDKHLEQFMAINARSVFVILALVVSILVGFDKIPDFKSHEHAGMTAATFFCIGLVLLTVSSVFISLFHTAKIRALELKSWAAKDMAAEDFQIIPSEGWMNPFRLTLVGIICVIVAVLILLKYKLFG